MSLHPGGVQFVRWADTRQMLQLVEQLSRLSLTLAALREQQGRAAQAAAALRGAELLTAEQTRRTHAAYVGVRGLRVMPATARTTASRPAQWPVPEPAVSWPPRPTGPAPAARPGRAR